VPDSLVDQLGPGGRLVLPVGEYREQELVLVERTADGVKTSRKGACRFVPLIGEEAFSLTERRR
jgi:protein-L-isoaspartate(D-aspartate) O-methyltransferase